jgi:hypothetical protein
MPLMCWKTAISVPCSYINRHLFLVRRLVLCLLNKDKSAFVKLEVSGVKIGWRTAAGGKESYNKQVKFFRIMPMNTI